ncbi:peptidyl-prolyl cis-trans isomerase [Sulfitobacter aestuarii]|uniref:Parvulin-like PPIase n=1 Tax=Sulfitobacter aestuarii TaxID=2161676 RepID=A0ABW5U071_9RHOB
MAKGSSITKTAVWVLMGMLILGLGGFGAINLSGNIRSIGSVGDKSIPVDQYARQLQQEIRAVEAQTGEPLTFRRAQEIGLDRAVLQRLVRNRALDHEASQLGLSIGDESLRGQILEISAFQGIDGKFDREGYRFALQQSGLSEAEFEASLREEAARTLLQGAIVGGVQMPQTYAETLVSYLREQRSFTWTLMDEGDLETPLPSASEEELRAYYEANSERFMLPASKEITYAWLSPDALIEEVEVSEEELRKEYENRAGEYQKPERRLVERLVFADAESADQAAAALEVDGTTFETLVDQRGLDLADVDLGDVGRLELEAAGEAVFAAEVGDVVGPLPSPLGPALFRVNGVLPAQNTSFEEARAALRQELAVSRAVRAVEARAQELDDQLAGGATLEQLAEESEMELGQIDWTEENSAGIAAYAAFREAAAALKEDDFPKIGQLDDGGIFALRLDEALPERPEPFEQARDDVEAAWRAEQIRTALVAQAEALKPALTGATAFTEAGLDAVIEEDMTRNGFVEDSPAEFMETVFKMQPGDVEILQGEEDKVAIVLLDNIVAAETDDDASALIERLDAQLDQALAQDVFDIYAEEVVRRAGPQVDQRAVAAVHVNFP